MRVISEYNRDRVMQRNNLTLLSKIFQRRDVLSFILHYTARDADAFSALGTRRHQSFQLLESLGLVQPHCGAYGFVAYRIT